jgi:hypothetical protein
MNWLVWLALGLVALLFFTSKNAPVMMGGPNASSVG